VIGKGVNNIRLGKSILRFLGGVMLTNLNSWGIIYPFNSDASYFTVDTNLITSDTTQYTVDKTQF
jgi:hypothetical protein